MDFIMFLVVLTYCSPKKYEIKGNIYGMLAEKIKYKLNSLFFFLSDIIPAHWRSRQP